MNSKNFLFRKVGNTVSKDIRTTKTIHIPKGIQTKDELLTFYYSEFPSFYEAYKNWDSFFDLIRDWEWVKEPKIEIRHSDIPLLTNLDDCNTYLSCLSEAVEFWREERVGNSGDDTTLHSLEVYFPNTDREYIVRILN